MRIIQTILAITFLSFISLSSFSQTKVMGIETSTTIDNFVKELKLKGYKGKADGKSCYRYKKIKFAGYSDCQLIVDYNKDTDSITCISVIFPQIFMSKEMPLPNNFALYSDIKGQLEKKYGPVTKEETAFYDDSSLGLDGRYDIFCVWLDSPFKKIKLLYGNNGAYQSPAFYELYGREMTRLDYYTKASTEERIVVSPDL